MLLEGQPFDQYRIVRLLRSGGMGEVYLADDVHLKRQVAIKVIRTDAPRYADADTAREAMRLFLREARVIAQLDHPHILPLYGSRKKRINGTTFMYMVMPFRHEGSLTDWLAKRGKSRPLSLGEVERIVKHAASALQYAHDHQIIHQDVKPSNFLIHGDTERANQLNLQLADFGVAKLIMATSESQTIRGTPVYMAPEHWEGQPVPATDQYALAVMAYELLTGHPPFVANNHDQMWYQHSHVQPQAPSTINPRIPKKLDAVLLRALSKTPEDRFASILAFAHAFRQAIFNSAIDPTADAASSRAPTAIEQTVLAPDVNDVTLRPPRTSGFSSRAFLQFGLVLLFIFGSLSVFYIAWMHQQGSGKISPTAAFNATHRDSTHSPVTGTDSTTTARVNSTGTAQTDATATAQTTTAAQISGTATTTAQLNAAATAQVATATAQIYATATAYTKRVNGTPSLDDPLQDNSQGYDWDVNYSVDNGGCAFTAGAYHSSMPQQGYISPCFARATDFSNFSYQVQMKIIKGDQAGISLRGDAEKGTFYYFHINRNGLYALEVYSNDISTATISKGSSSAIKTGLNQSNLITVVAKGRVLELYVNMQYITSVSDSTYNHGQIGVVAENTGNPTEVAFTNAKVQTL